MPIAGTVISPSNGPSQIGAQDPSGELFGALPSKPIGFFGGGPAGPITQPGSAGGNFGVPGTAYVVSVTVTATSVAPNTSAEQTFAVTNAAVGQIVAVQKPTVDAGISIVGARVSGAGSVAITYANDTAATITPTAGQTYAFELLPASITLTAALTPAAVAPNAVSQQFFPVPGIPAGTALIVNKPTAQAGLGIVDANVPAAGQVAVTFANFTAATITPTAGETYTFAGFAQLDIAPVMRTLQVTLTPVSVAANTSAEQTFTVPGLPASSAVIVNKPSATAGLGLGGARVSALNTLAINYVNNTSAAIVPPSEVYTIASFPAPIPAAGSANTYNVAAGGPSSRSVMVALGLVAGP